MHDLRDRALQRVLRSILRSYAGTAQADRARELAASSRLSPWTRLPARSRPAAQYLAPPPREEVAADDRRSRDAAPRAPGHRRHRRVGRGVQTLRFLVSRLPRTVVGSIFMVLRRSPSFVGDCPSVLSGHSRQVVRETDRRRDRCERARSISRRATST
jgi:hypothetical protein